MFGEVVEPRGRGWGRRGALQLASVGAHGAAAALLLRLWSQPVVEPPQAIPVRLVQPSARPAPPPPPRAAARQAKTPPVARRPQALIAPTVVPDELPPPGPKEEAETSEYQGPEVAGGVTGGREGGVVGGTVGAPEAAPLLPARPADLASVRAGIARTLVYPPEAKRRGLGGRTIVAFTLLADGSIADLEVRVSSGYASLDEAALDSIRRAAPFDPPGVDVAVVIPVAFRLR